MFDVHHHPRVTERVTQEINITERRAPTEESVRMLREMEAAARAAIVASVRVENCAVDAVLHRQEDHLNDTTMFACIYNINGQKRTVRYDHIQKVGDDSTAAARGMVKAIGEDVAFVILCSVENAMKTLRMS